MGYFRNLRNKAKLARAFAVLVKDPNRTEAIFTLGDNIGNPALKLAVLARLKSAPDVSQILRERYLPPAADVTALSRYPEGTLGKTYVSFLQRNGLDAVFYPAMPVVDDLTYFRMRARQTHDIFHVMLGHDASLEGEIAVQAFLLAQTASTLPAVLIAAGLLHVLIYAPTRASALVESIATGWAQGKRARPFFAEKWEEHWSRPIKDYQQYLFFDRENMSA